MCARIKRIQKYLPKLEHKSRAAAPDLHAYTRKHRRVLPNVRFGAAPRSLAGVHLVNGTLIWCSMSLLGRNLSFAKMRFLWDFRCDEMARVHLCRGEAVAEVLGWGFN
ncbi:hypothetical protein Zmor_023007 [Zophobas morio]|uniref:Uncharacterized protein n=1 Tax=Zophobas morio TaxID=2755281 RepID=A0AA38HYV1_9CUCU|nr:hypothetical protein Zmor_023007 [Zophobas morio]